MARNVEANSSFDNPATNTRASRNAMSVIDSCRGLLRRLPPPVTPSTGASGNSPREKRTLAVETSSSFPSVVTRTNIGTKCPPGSGPLGFEVHCEGEIYGQTTWDLAQALVAKHGYHTGWRTSERIFYVSLPDAGSYLATGSFPVYNAYIAVDDDDGNLTNGTPNGGEIYAAFNTHEIAGTPRTSSAGCTRPPQPAVTVTPACDRFTVSWTASAGATSYQVLRSDLLADAPFFPVATVAPPLVSYVDTEVAPGQDYRYVVMAVTAGGCESTIESPVLGRLVPQPILSAVAAVTDDIPRGNRSGYADPGEEVDLRVTLGNFGDLASGPVDVTMTSATPGVTILDGTDAWSSIGPGAQADNTGVLRFLTSAGTMYFGSCAAS